jgi:hypothetical protein
MLTYPEALWLFFVLALLGPVLAWKAGRISGADQMRRDMLAHPSVRSGREIKRAREAA